MSDDLPSPVDVDTLPSQVIEAVLKRYCLFEVKPSQIPNAGRGVFSNVHFQSGDLVMSDRLLSLKSEDLCTPSRMKIWVSTFGDYLYMSFGLHQLVNNAFPPRLYPPNVQAHWYFYHDRVDFIALTDIKPGDELYHPYGDEIVHPKGDEPPVFSKVHQN